nr:hypothetical protein [Pseudarthrobacter sp. NBSH8]
MEPGTVVSIDGTAWELDGDDTMIARKVRFAPIAGLTPMLCVGEPDGGTTADAADFVFRVSGSFLGCFAHDPTNFGRVLDEALALGAAGCPASMPGRSAGLEFKAGAYHNERTIEIRDTPPFDGEAVLKAEDVNGDHRHRFAGSCQTKERPGVRPTPRHATGNFVPLYYCVLDASREVGQAGMESPHPEDNSGQTWRLAWTGTVVHDARADDSGQRILVVGCDGPY